MKTRLLVAAVILFFAWRGSVSSIHWPPLEAVAGVRCPQPSAENRRWAAPLTTSLSKITPPDRNYLANFYDAMAFVVERDGKQAKPVITDTGKFEAFHGGSLRLAVDREDVGKYPGLGEAIDATIANALGSDAKSLDEATRQRVVDACAVLAWTFTIHGE